MEHQVKQRRQPSNYIEKAYFDFSYTFERNRIMGMLSNMLSEINMPSAKTVVSTTASIAASAMVIRTIARDLVPYELQNYVFSSIRGLFRSFSSEVTLIIEEFTGIVGNQIYDAAEIYLGSKISPFTQKFKVNMPDKETKVSTSMAKNQEIVDVFNGVKFKWRQITIEVESKRPSYPGQSSSKSEVRYFELKFHKKYKQIVFDSYFRFLLEQSKKVKEERKTLKIHTLNSEHSRRYTGANNAWNSITLEHPSTFDTLAIDPDIKKTIMDDLERFVRRKDLYKKVGKAWKRGYLLYGPPGTGKSSLIAAMANYLQFDIYDLELNDIHENGELRRLLIGTANRCILVVEDIDCSLELEDRQDQKMMKMLQTNQVRQAQTVNIVKQQRSSQVTLSGLLNFIDGLWSSCGDERIIVFTTNHKERLDTALLRPGRMDVHIHMSYCTFSSFKILASNYLGINTHPLFYEIEKLLGETTVTPAEVGEQLLKSEGDEETLQGLVEFLIEKKREKKEIEEMEESRRKEEEIEKKNKEKEKESVGNEATPEG